MRRFLVGYSCDRFYDSPTTLMNCNVLITLNETHPHDTFVCIRERWDKETNTTLLPLGDVRGGKPISKEMIDRGSEANVTTIAICVASKKKTVDQGTKGIWIPRTKRTG